MAWIDELKKNFENTFNNCKVEINQYDFKNVTACVVNIDKNDLSEEEKQSILASFEQLSMVTGVAFAFTNRDISLKAKERQEFIEEFDYDDNYYDDDDDDYDGDDIFD